jgi:CHAT domain-containing protein
MIHLACHGRFSASNPLGSGIRLADGWLTVRDIYALRLDADLVTLSGCETGVNLVHAGDELTGLVRGFLAAGCRSVLVSLWRVHDESAMEFMCRFCRHKGVHDSSDSCHNGRSVRLAQLELLDERAHPAFWAPFALVGES